ncbi:MAG: hypothetical protein HPY61_14035 [Methanotrichaceae archaeon]|nr:hypothetical protein [Methanotrichaceae archaeon]
MKAMLLLVQLLAVLAMGTSTAFSVSSIEDIQGHIDPGRSNFYTIPGLQKGDTLYLYGRGTSGNLDPFLAVANSSLNKSLLIADFKAEVEQDIKEGQDPLDAIPEIADRYFLAWDDDGGGGYDAAVKFQVPAGGDYGLLFGSSPAEMTFGDYLLTVGVNAPSVLTGKSVANRDGLALLDKNLSGIGYAVQEIRGNLSANKTSTFYNLRALSGGDTLYVYIEAESGDLKPVLMLTDFGNKTLGTGNWGGLANSANLLHTFEQGSKGNRIIIKGGEENGSSTTGSYRLLLGINAPEVLAGKAEAAGQSIAAEPIKVKAGVELDQITAINQLDQNFNVVANIWMQWENPELAFSPQECNCSFKVYRSIEQFTQEYGSNFPEFTIFNQQGNRWTQNRVIVVRPDGTATYFERFWVTLQAPDFDFRRYPLDKQDFYLLIDSLYPEEYYIYQIWPEKTEIGRQLGEEEWYITSSDTNVSSVKITDVNSRFSFHFQAQRHLLYYAFRILLPIFVIVFISWVTFFLKDYGKRGDIAGANLLLFIAFNFTIGSDLPKLGYLTLLDWFMFFTFVLTALIFVYNLSLKLLEVRDKKALAERIDRIMIWIYPLLYIMAFIIAPWIIYKSQ